MSARRKSRLIIVSIAIALGIPGGFVLAHAIRVPLVKSLENYQPAIITRIYDRNGIGFAEYSITPAARVFRMPDGMDFPEAAAVPIVYHTSYFALKQRAALQSGEWLLVHAGASGVGMSAIQIGKAMGAGIIATAREMGASVIAEGIETVETLELVHDIVLSNGSDCNRFILGMQGYLLGRPKPQFLRETVARTDEAAILLDDDVPSLLQGALAASRMSALLQ